MATRIVTRTSTGSTLQTARGLGLKHNVLDFTTINQAISERTIVSNLPEPLTTGMDVLPGYDYQTDSDQLFAKYICIGNGGHKNIAGTSTTTSTGVSTTPGATGSTNVSVAVPYTLPIPHRATDTGLYNQIPFLIRTVASDLSVSERKKYCLRRTISIDGVLYAAYYGLVLDYAQVVPTTNITYVVDGESTTVQFVPTINNLRPTHPTEDTTYDASYVDVTAPVSIVFNETQIQDMRDACRILYGNEYLAIISEIAICSGVSKSISQKYPNSGPQTPTTVPANTFFETVACQVIMFISTYAPVSFAEREYKLDLDFGASEPIFGVTAG